MVIVSGIFSHILLDEFNVSWSVRKASLALLPGFVCIGQINQLKYLVQCSTAANVFLVTAFLLTLYLMSSEHGALKVRDKPLFRSWETMPNFINMTLFTMDGIGALMPSANNMKNPEKFLGCPGVLSTAMCTLLVMYLVMGFVGYVTFGDKIMASVTMNLRGNNVYTFKLYFLLNHNSY